MLFELIDLNPTRFNVSKKDIRQLVKLGYLTTADVDNGRRVARALTKAYADVWEEERGVDLEIALRVRFCPEAQSDRS